jgi:hypothetical protein
VFNLTPREASQPDWYLLLVCIAAAFLIGILAGAGAALWLVNLAGAV